MRKPPLTADILAIALSLLVILGSSLVFRKRGGEMVIIRGENATLRYSLDEERILEVEGPLGVTVVSIRDGGASIISSPCDGKDCTKMAPVTKKGGFAACLPNHVLVTLEGEDGEVDDVTT